MSNHSNTKIQLDPTKLVGFEVAANDQAADPASQAKGVQGAESNPRHNAKIGTKDGINSFSRAQAKVGGKIGRKDGAKVGQKDS